MRTDIGNSVGYSRKLRAANVPRREHPFPAFNTVVRALWPDKTAAHLAAVAGVSERCAKFWLSGDRAPSTAAFLAVLNTITKRQ